MQFYKTLENKVHFSEKTNQDDILFCWDKRKNVSLENSIDLKDIFNFYRVSQILELAEVFNSKHFNSYTNIKKKIHSTLRSFHSVGIDVSKFKLSETVPQSLLKEFIFQEMNILEDSVKYLQTKSWYYEVINFFLKDKRTDVIKKLNFPLKTKRGLEHVNLRWQANFRFRSEPGFLNLFNMQEHERDIIIPQRDDHILYYADFRQFEIRTYCLIHPELEVDFEDRELYTDFAKRLNLDFADAKRQIIAYTYGQHNPKLDEVFDRKKILENVQGDYFNWKGLPIIFRPQDSDKIKIHTIVQTISQYFYLEKLTKLLDYLSETNSIFMYPLHDSVIISMPKGDQTQAEYILSILEDDVYKVKQCMGEDFTNLKEI